MPPQFDYEQSEEHGLKVSRIGEEEYDSIREIVESGARLTRPRMIAHGDAEVRVEGEEVVIKTDNQIRGKVRKDGTLEWFSDALIGGKIQVEGGRFDLWQKVVSTGDNLIELNTGVDGTSLKAPYSGIEVNRGEEQPNTFLVFPEDTKRWTTVMAGRQRKLALHGDRLSNFKQDLTTDEIPEGDENKYARPTTSSQNFWVSDKLKETRGTNREILPAFVPVSEAEMKKLTNCRAKLSTGTAEIQVMVEGQPAADPFRVEEKVLEQDLSFQLDDGAEVGIDILDVSNARNLSVSITVLTSFI